MPSLDRAARIDALLRRAGVRPDDGGPRPAAAACAPQGGCTPVREDAPLSFAQERLWFLDQLRPGDPAYNVTTAIELIGRLDLASLWRALAQVARRHEVLRTRFSMSGEEPVQVVVAAAPPPRAIVDLSGVDEEHAISLARALCEEAARRGFCLSEAPHWRVLCVCLDASRHVLAVVMHHAATDGASSDIFVRDLAACYTAEVTKQPAALPPLPVQYRDYARWQRDRLASGALDEALAYWTRTLSGMRIFEPPVDRARDGSASRGATRLAIIERGEQPIIADWCRAENATTFMLMLAAMVLVLHAWSGERDIVVGTDLADRTRVETEHLMGFFVNQAALRVSLEGAETVRAVLRRVQTCVLGALAHQDAPFDAVVRALRPTRERTGAPLFRVVCAYHALERGGDRLPGLRVRPFAIADETTRFELSLRVAADDRGLWCFWTYAHALFEPSTIERVIAAYARVWDAIAANPEMPIAVLREDLASSLALAPTASPAAATAALAASPRPGRRTPIRVSLGEVQ